MASDNASFLWTRYFFIIFDDQVGFFSRTITLIIPVILSAKLRNFLYKNWYLHHKISCDFTTWSNAHYRKLSFCFLIVPKYEKIYMLFQKTTVDRFDSFMFFFSNCVYNIIITLIWYHVVIRCVLPIIFKTSLIISFQTPTVV